ncbi:MAG: hypothetical protein IKO84_01920 [Butyrivibrio sp.]|nr:hypothetical protein [Butyrivibrio sp.]
MLGTLIKHEFKKTWIIMTLICAVTIVLGILGGIFFKLTIDPDFSSEANEFILAFGIIGFAMILSALSMATTIYLVVHYYRSLYSSQGYLSFTLPVSITEVVSSRVIIGFTWSLLVSLSMGLALFAAVGIPGGLAYVKEFYDELISTVEVSQVYKVMILCVFAIIFRSFATLMTYFFCISIGQLWGKHKILGAVLCYFATSFVLMIFSFGFNYRMFFSPDAFTGLDSFEYLATTLVKTIVYSVVTIAIFYGAAIFTSNKQLNLD